MAKPEQPGQTAATAAAYGRLAALIGASLVAMLTPTRAQAELWALDVSGVWDGPGNRRIQWNPATGQIGNMGNAGVSFSIGAAPANAQVAARAGAASGFEEWNLFAAVPTVRIDYLLTNAGPNVKIPLTWGNVAGTPGEATGAAPGYNPDPIVLNQNVTLRTDGWNLDLAGAKPPLINEYDVFTTAVHESGHTLGLGHPQSLTQVMTPQDTARQNAAGRWSAVAQTTPFAGQPLTITGAVQPNGALDYRNPRISFGFGDALGAMTLYSAPISRITSFFTALGGGRGDYTYTVENVSANGTVQGMTARSGYDTREVDIPVAPGVPVSNLTAPSGWTLTRGTGDVVATFVGSGTGLLPGGDLTFSFESVDQNVLTEPSLHWDIEGLGACASSTDDDRGCATPAFNASDFTVLTGQYDYTFNGAADAWQIVALDAVLTPIVAEPGSLGLLGSGLTVLGLLRRRVAKRRSLRCSS